MSVKVIDSFRRIVAQKGASNIGQVVADADNDTLTVLAGAGINLGVDEISDSITISTQGADEVVASALGKVEIRADDSTVRTIQGGENFGILGGTSVVTTASNAEGDITISVDRDLSNYDNSTSAFLTNIQNESLNDLVDVTTTGVANNHLLQYDSNTGRFVTRTITAAGFAAVSTTGSYNDLSNRPNLTIDGDMSGSTGGVLAGGASTLTLTLDTVNSNVGTFNNVTVNAKGLVTGATQTTFATVATSGDFNDLANIPDLSSTYNFNITADDSTLEAINSSETIQIKGGTNVTTSLNDGVVTITGPANLSDLNNDLRVSEFTNDAQYITIDDIPDSFNFKVGADDSTARNVGLGEQINFIGATGITTSSDAEGNITITGPSLTNFGQNLNTAGNTGTGSVALTSETLQVLGTTGQIRVDAAAFALSISLENLINTDLKGSVFADDSTLLVDGVSGSIPASVVSGTISNALTPSSINMQGNIHLRDSDYIYLGNGDDAYINYNGNNTNFLGDETGEFFFGRTHQLRIYARQHNAAPANSIHIQNINGGENRQRFFVGDANTPRLTIGGSTAEFNANIEAPGITATAIMTSPTFDGDLTGSVFADNSTLLVDGINGIIPSANVSGTEATNWNTAYSWGDHSTQGYASTSYVDTEVAGIVNSAPEQLNTLNELSAALNNDGNFATTITNRFTSIENNLFSIGADDSTMRVVKQSENIKILGGTNLTTSSDAEGNITVNFVNPGYITSGLEVGDNVSQLTNDAGYLDRILVAGNDSTVKTITKDNILQIDGTGAVTSSTDANGRFVINVSDNLNDFTNGPGFISGNQNITLFGDVTGSGTTSINVTLADSPIAPGTYNRITFDTKGIAQSGSLVDYLTDGSNVSRLTNDAGYLTNEQAINFNIVGDDSTGFNMANQGTFQFEGTNGITTSANTDTTMPKVQISGANFVQTGGNISNFANDSGYYKAGDSMIGNFKGSVFADDSTILVDAAAGKLSGTLVGQVDGDLTGSVFADDSALVIEGATGNITTPVANIGQLMNLAILSTEPSNPTNGMVCIASGESGEWNPGGLSAGTKQMVVYLGAWRQIASGGGA